MPSTTTDPGQPINSIETRSSLSKRRRLSKKRILAYAMIVGTVPFLAFEGLCSVVFAFMDATRSLEAPEFTHVEYDPDLGWRHIANKQVRGLYDEGSVLTTNSQRFRAKEDYSKEIPAGRHRIMCVGDSFTMGYGVSDSESFPAQIESRDSRLQVVNMGMGGYGVDQMYLWYRRVGGSLNANTVVFAFITKDLWRMNTANYFKPKPTLRFEGGVLTVRGTPTPTEFISSSTSRSLRAFTQGLSSVRTARGIADSVFAPSGTWWNTGHEFPLKDEVRALLSWISSDCKTAKRNLIVVHLPTKPEILVSDPSDTPHWVREHCEANAIPFVALRADFLGLRPWEFEASFRPDDGHYTVKGNAIVADAVLRALRLHFDDVPR